MDHEQPVRRVIAVGASAGGPRALRALVAQLPADLPAAVLVVQHVAPDAPLLLAEILDRAGPLPTHYAQDGETLQAARIYIAPPNQHMLLRRSEISLVAGPRENFARPSIDVLFRSAAVHYNARLIGVLLTGLMHDGTVGLRYVAQSGGVTMVQDPEEAAFPELITNALQRVTVDFRLPLEEMGDVLTDLCRAPIPEEVAVPENIRKEAQLVERMTASAEELDSIGEQVPVVCPECGGPLWQMAEAPSHYRCLIGHSFGEDVLQRTKQQAIEEALWSALRTMEEQAHLQEKLAEQERSSGHVHTAASFAARASETRRHADQLREFILGPGVGAWRTAEQG